MSGRNKAHTGMHRGGPMAMMPGEKPQNFSESMKKLLAYLNRHMAAMIIAWATAVFATIFNSVGPVILGKATDELLNGVLAQNVNFGRIGEILLWLSGLYIISAMFTYVQGWVMTKIAMKVTYHLRRDVMDKIQRLPLAYFDKSTHGEILSRIINDVDTINQTLNQSMSQIVMSITTVVGICVIMAAISWQLTIAVVLSIPISMLLVSQIVKRSHKHFVGQQKLLGSVNGIVEEMFGSHSIVKAFGGEKINEENFQQQNKELYQAAWKANFLSGMIMPIAVFVSNLAYVLVCVFGGRLVAAGGMTVGGVQAFIQYVRQFNHPVTQIANISNILQQTAAAAERVFEFLAEPEEEPEVDKHQSLAISAEHGVEFEQVSFGYSADKILIHNFNAVVKAGQKVAIVGPTGAGKTTMVKLLMRFYDVNQGKITVGGVDIRDMRRGELRSVFGMVLQDTWLFKGTIRDNIRYGRVNASDQEVVQAAKAAQAHHFIKTLPKGYDMIINEDVNNISQGQKQLLTIARAFLKDPQILILDEATSSVDTRTEVLIQKAMENLMHGRTSFIIAHRLSTIRNADLILVMDNGNIVEQGTHEQLMEAGGFYERLYSVQFENDA